MSSNIRVNSITPSVGNNVAIGTAGGTITFNCDTISGIATFANDIDITQKLDVDGHTELDNVNISGVVTSISFVGPLTGNVTGNLTGNVTGNTSGTAGGLTGSPSITVTDITASGNVSVAGTLTYEDVTSIDAVGIITAQAGIHVTSGSVGVGTTNPQDILHVYGTATNFTALAAIESSAQNDGILQISGPNIFSGAGVGHLDLGQNANGATVTADSTGSGSNHLIFQSTLNGITEERLRITSIGNVGISSAIPKTDVDISQKTGAVALPQGTTAQRPSGSAPYIRKNTTNNALEYFDGTSWVEIITDYFPTGSTILG